jgi:hypothetical protein
MVMMIPKKRQSSGIPHLSRPFVAAEGYAFHDEKSSRPVGEVLSCEFWVLSCLARAGAEETRETK